MMQPKIQHLQELKAEMLAVVRGERAVSTNCWWRTRRTLEEMETGRA